LSAWLPATAYVLLFGEWRDNVPVGEIIAATVIYGIASTFLSYLFTAGVGVPLALVLGSQNQLSVLYLSLAGLLAGGVSFCALTTDFSANHFLLGAAFGFTVALVFGLAIGAPLRPNNSSKPTPLRGAA